MKTELFENTLQTRGVWKCQLFIFLWAKNILKMELFEIVDLTIIMWFPRPIFFWNVNPKQSVLFVFLNSSGVVWTKTFDALQSATFVSISSCVLWMRPEIKAVEREAVWKEERDLKEYRERLNRQFIMFLFPESTKWVWENQIKISGFRETKNRVAGKTGWVRPRGKISQLWSSVFVVFVSSLLKFTLSCSMQSSVVWQSK